MCVDIDKIITEQLNLWLNNKIKSVITQHLLSHWGRERLNKYGRLLNYS